MAELLTDVREALEPGEIDDWLVVSSIASQKCMEVVLDVPGMPTAGGTNPLVNFQLVNYKRRNDPHEGNITFQGFSYNLPTFLPKEFLDKYLGGTDRHVAKDNLTGTADIAYDILLEHRKKQVDVMVQSLQQVATPSSQQMTKLVRSTISVLMLDVEPEMAWE